MSNLELDSCVKVWREALMDYYIRHPNFKWSSRAVAYYHGRTPPSQLRGEPAH